MVRRRRRLGGGGGDLGGGFLCFDFEREKEPAPREEKALKPLGGGDISALQSVGTLQWCLSNSVTGEVEWGLSQERSPERERKALPTLYICGPL